MSSILQSHESLPYIDSEPTEAERRKANDLVAAHLPSGHAKALHPALSSLSEPQFSPLMQAEISRAATGAKREGGVDLSRYEAPDEPATDSSIDEWRSAIRRAYISGSYLSDRHQNLSLLEESGKNAWLIGNAQLEEILQDLEKQLAELKTQTDEVNKARKAAQESSKGEVMGLEETWRRGVGKMIEVQVATAGLRQEILSRRRTHAG